MKACLIGEKLSHSYSVNVHRALGCEYDLVELGRQEIAQFARSGDYDCFNVTIPYKRDIFDCLDFISDEAVAIGAVNTVVRQQGRLFGYNTDIEGMRLSFKNDGVSLKGKKVLVLGSGGTCKTAIYLSATESAKEVVIVGRQQENNYDNIHLHFDSEIIINTTPVGMYPQVGESAIDLRNFKKCEYIFDAIYNPLRTKLLLDAEKCGIKCRNGLFMLVAQAVCAELYFSKVMPCKVQADNVEQEIERVYDKLKKEVQNVTLIGMPSSGKSVVGAQLAQLLGRKFVDTDAEIENRIGKKISDIFAEKGESFFREQELVAVKEFGKENGLIIAVGGGAVMTEGAADALRQNGIIVWLKRNAQKAVFEGRPLLQSIDDYNRLCAERESTYRALADIIVENDGSVLNAVRQIEELL